MNGSEVRETIHRIGILPSVRVNSRDLATFAAEMVYAAGIPLVEITMTTPGALEIIDDLANRHEEDLELGSALARCLMRKWLNSVHRGWSQILDQPGICS